jgi:hypothetical protein
MSYFDFPYVLPVAKSRRGCAAPQPLWRVAGVEGRLRALQPGRGRPLIRKDYFGSSEGSPPVVTLGNC